ncbi:SET domain-containing protein-lysine N-methyltransferase [Iodidimonas sp. SYSU 1G8]|uniref:SET domain-containing protein-lysine N-methyltransferase n=1 Tax=Iodidimonas sp. SYSU 1G8 TaxID=3133967 RepID=UPI0031FEA6EA
MTHVLTRLAPLSIGPSPLGGRGLFADAPIAEGALITSASVLVLPPEETPLTDQGLLRHYVFDWTPDAETTQYAVAFGEISFCNHSPAPNCRFDLDKENLCIRLHAARDIAAGEELTIDYAYEEFPFEVVAG